MHSLHSQHIAFVMRINPQKPAEQDKNTPTLIEHSAPTIQRVVAAIGTCGILYKSMFYFDFNPNLVWRVNWHDKCSVLAQLGMQK